MFETILFAMLAVFLGLRLYAVLGKRSGHEQQLGAPAEEPQAQRKPAAVTAESRDAPLSRQAEDLPVDPFAATGIRAVAASDPRFNAADFIDGAKAAYAMILEAFWKGDGEALAPYVSEDVRDAFAEAIEARNTAGEALDNRLIAIERAVISHAEVDGQNARITVRFDADIAAVTRDANGKVVAGSLTDAVPTHDAWTFERSIKSADPNWILVDTDEAA